MSLLVQFLLRLTFGLAFGMAITSSKQVSSGYFRNHLYVTLGLSTLAGLLCFSVAPGALWYVGVAAVCSYLSAVYWLFEKAGAGKFMLWIVVIASLLGALAHASTTTIAKRTIDGVYYSDSVIEETIKAGNSTELPSAIQEALSAGQSAELLSGLSVLSSGLLLGLAMAAMLLGHWYLNSPGMVLAPLYKLILAIGIAVGLQLILSSIGLWSEISNSEQLTTQWILFVLLRWTFGIVGVGAMAWMAWQTLKIPNTQSATGILYVAVIGTFVGETMALLLSSESLFPL